MITRAFALLVLLSAACKRDAGIPGTYVLVAHGNEQRYTFSDSGTYVVDVAPTPRRYRTAGDTAFLEVILPDFPPHEKQTPDTMAMVLRADTLRSVHNYAFFMVRQR